MRSTYVQAALVQPLFSIGYFTPLPLLLAACRQMSPFFGYPLPGRTHPETLSDYVKVKIITASLNRFTFEACWLTVLSKDHIFCYKIHESAMALSFQPEMLVLNYRRRDKRLEMATVSIHPKHCIDYKLFCL